MRPIILFISLVFFSSTLLSSDEILTPNDFISKKGRWVNLRKSEEGSLRLLISILESTPTGASVLKSAREKAREKGLTLLDVVKTGEGSLTDTTLIRKFKAENPDQIIYESKTVVILNRDLSVLDALLDLAHELTHFTERTPFNPYEINFSLPEFVAGTIEGKGGEAEAYMVECQVYRDLYPIGSRSGSNCDKIMDGLKFSKEKTIDLFYRIGKYNTYFEEQIAKYNYKKSEFFKVLDGQPEFISSAYNLPYPVAAVFEYISIMERACENDEKRIAMMRSQKEGRAPASENGLAMAAKSALYDTLLKSYKKRCEHHVKTDQIETIYSSVR